MRRGAAAFLALFLSTCIDSACAADDYRVSLIRQYVETRIKPWIHDPIILAALKKDNALHAALRDEDIQLLDRLWREERASGQYKLIQGVLSSPASALLRQKSDDSTGVITEIILMDARGLNVAVSTISSDYWQGDEMKFRKTFEAGANGLFIDEPEKDDSTQVLQSQASMTITDAKGNPIGAITVGINLDYL